MKAPSAHKSFAKIEPETKPDQQKDAPAAATLEKEAETAVLEDKAEDVVKPPSGLDVKPRKMPELKGRSSGLRTLRITNETTPEGVEGLQVRATRATAAPELASSAVAPDVEDEPVLLLAPTNGLPTQRSLAQTAMTYGGGLLTLFWAAFCIAYVVSNYTVASLFALSPQELGGLFAGMMAPVALLWMTLTHAQRGTDIQRYAEALRSELQSIIFPSDERSQRVNKDIERLCQQAAELSQSSKAVIKSIARARQGLRTEIRDFVGVSKKTEFHIDRLAETLQDRAGKLATLTGE
ncbi:MAG: hypothetical protein KKA05_03995, partial [Alphaproteobacteria bacterium]|nr:hypothetical protein [Alphaproteobacteria bacterium]